MIYFLEDISGFFGEYQQGILGDLFSMRSHITLMSSCPGFTDKGSLVLGGKPLGQLPWFPFGPLENSQILVPQNRGSSGLLTLLSFHPHSLPSTTGLFSQLVICRFFQRRSGPCSFFPSKLVGTDDHYFPKNTCKFLKLGCVSSVATTLSSMSSFLFFCLFLGWGILYFFDV